MGRLVIYKYFRKRKFLKRVVFRCFQHFYYCKRYVLNFRLRFAALFCRKTKNQNSSIVLKINWFEGIRNYCMYVLLNQMALWQPPTCAIRFQMVRFSRLHLFDSVVFFSSFLLLFYYYLYIYFFIIFRFLFQFASSHFLLFRFIAL